MRIYQKVANRYRVVINCVKGAIKKPVTIARDWRFNICFSALLALNTTHYLLAIYSS